MTTRRDGLRKQPGSPYWFADFVDAAGIRRRKSTKRTSRREAGKVRATWIHEAGRGVPIVPANVGFDDLVAGLEASYGQKSNKSWHRVESSLKHLRPAFGGLKASRVTRTSIDAYDHARMEAGAQPATRRYELSNLQRMLKLAVERGQLAVVPVFPSIRVNNAREEYITDEDYAALSAELPEHLRAKETVGYWTGWRRQTLEGLTWEQGVNFKTGELWLPRGTTKSGEPVRFPFHNLPELKAAIDRQRAYVDRLEHITGRQIPWVFVKPDGTQDRGCLKAWRSACRRAGVVDAQGRTKRFHDNRRSAARAMEQAGVPRSVSKKLLDHKTDQMFTRYSVVAGKDLENGTAKLAALRHTPGIVDGGQGYSGTTQDVGKARTVNTLQ